MSIASGSRFPTSSKFTQSQLQAPNESQEQELKAALEKERKALQKFYPHAGDQSDILHLNIGGSTNVAVYRRTLTHFEDSMLASLFSGRWDDGLPKTKCGSFFIDQDPKVFLPLLNYLRQCDHNTSSKVKIPPPPPTLEFCTMLEYYGLLSSIYPQQWRQVGGLRDGVVMTTSLNDDSFTISSKNKVAFAMDVLKPLNASSFTARFENGSTVQQVGWAVDLGGGKGFVDSRDISQDDYFGFVLTRGEFVYPDGCRVEGNLPESLFYYFTFPIAIVGRRDPTSNSYSIQVMDNDKINGTTTCLLNVERPEMYPHFIFQGKVTISYELYL